MAVLFHIRANGDDLAKRNHIQTGAEWSTGCIPYCGLGSVRDGVVGDQRLPVDENAILLVADLLCLAPELRSLAFYRAAKFAG